MQRFASVLLICSLVLTGVPATTSVPAPGDVLDGTNALCAPSSRDCVAFTGAALSVFDDDQRTGLVGASALDPDGSAIYLARHTEHHDFPRREHGRIIALSLEDPDTILWDHVTAQSQYARIRDITVTPDGSTVIAVGRLGLSGGDGYVVALDASTGAVLWEHVEDSRPESTGDEDEFWQVSLSPDGETAYAVGNFEGLGHNSNFFHIAVFAYEVATGTKQWVHSLDGGSVGDVAVGPEGTIYIAGTLLSGAGVVAIGPDGSQQWLRERQFGDFHHLAVSPDGQRIAASGIDYAGGTYPGMVMMWDSEGNQQWRHTIPRTPGYTIDQRDIAFGVGYQTFISGPVPTDDGTRTIGAIRSLDALGNPLWTNEFQGWVDNRDAANSAVHFAAGQVYAIAQGWNDHRLLVLDPLDGAIRWGADMDRYDIAVERGGGNSDELGLHVTPDGGQVFVAGADMDRSDNSGSAAPAVFRYPNHAPVPVIDAPAMFGEGVGFLLDGTGSYDADVGDDIVALEWLQGTTTLGTGTTLTTSTTAETTCYTLRATDSWGATAETEVCRDLNHLPIAVLDTVPDIIQDVAGHVFDAGGSYDPDGDAITEYAWTLDGATFAASGPTAAPSLAGLHGAHCVQLTVTDSFGLESAPDEACFDVNRAPLLEATGPAVALVDAVVTFDATASSDPDGDPVAVTWYPHWNDDELADPATLSFPLALIGNQCIDAVADDGRGATTTQTLCTFVNAPPTAAANDPFASPVNLGQTLTGDASGSSDPNPEHVDLDFAWTVDGAPVAATASTPLGPFLAPGIHCAEVTVTDPLDAAGSVTRCGEVTDGLLVDVVMDGPFTVTDQVTGTVQVQWADGHPYDGADASATVSFLTGSPIDALLEAIGCGPWTTTGTTDAAGQFAFTLPHAVAERCLALGAGVAHLPSTLLGTAVATYEATARASDGWGNHGADATDFTVGLI